MTLGLNLSLSKKALLLVAVPVLSQIVLFSVLTNLLAKIETERAKEAHSRTLVTHLSMMLASHFKRNSLLFMSRISGNDSYGEQANQVKVAVHEQMAAIDAIVKPDSSESLAWGNIKAGAAGLDGSMRAATAAYNSGEKTQAALAWRDGQTIMAKMFEDVDKLTKEEQHLQQSQALSLDRYNRELQFLLVASLCIGIFLAFLLAYYFNRSTSRRLDVLLSNARRLAAGLAPNQKLRGNDELGELDGVYHDLHRSLSVMRRKERAVIENAADVICSLDNSFRFTDINGVVKTAWGLEPEAVLGRRITDLLAESERAAVGSDLQQAMQDGHVVRFTAGMVVAEGRQRTTAWSATWSEEERSFYCVVQDITERANMERMKSDFVAMVSHDLRTPLSAIQMAHSLVEEEPISERSRKTLIMAKRSVERLLNMVNNLLDVERMQSGALEIYPQSLPLSGTVSAALNSMQILADKRKLSLQAQVPDDLYAYFDQERILQVLVNLLANAFKFSPDNSKIVIRAGYATELKRLVKVEVVDQGVGIAPDKCAVIFDRFAQATADDRLNEDGVGLGLSICKAIIVAHGGEIGVVSTPGTGSDFWFTLPVNGAGKEKG